MSNTKTFKNFKSNILDSKLSKDEPPEFMSQNKNCKKKSKNAIKKNTLIICAKNAAKGQLTEPVITFFLYKNCPSTQNIVKHFVCTLLLTFEQFAYLVFATDKLLQSRVCAAPIGSILAQAACVRHACAMRSLAIVISFFLSSSFCTPCILPHPSVLFRIFLHPPSLSSWLSCILDITIGKPAKS